MEERCSGFPVERKRSAESPRVWTSVFEYVAIHRPPKRPELRGGMYVLEKGSGHRT